MTSLQSQYITEKLFPLGVKFKAPKTFVKQSRIFAKWVFMNSRTIFLMLKLLKENKKKKKKRPNTREITRF